jgi:hypothetical protein
MAEPIRHKVSGWTRTPAGWGNWTIRPTDGTGDRVVAFLSAGTWQNLPGDDRAKAETDRVVLISGDPLPDWAVTWLETANRKQCTRAREAFRSALDDADWADDRRTFGDS